MFAVDLGASGGKCFSAVLNDGAFSMQELHRFSHEGVSFHLADAGGSVRERNYWDDILLYRNIITGLQTYSRDVSNTLDSIGIDTWGTDGHFMSMDGEMLGKIYSYRDHRLDDMIENVKARIDAERIYSISGIHFQPFNLSNQLHWFAGNRRDLLRPGCFFLPIPTVFYYYLGGVRKVDSTWASVSQLMDAHSGTWSNEILEKLDIPPDVMPEIVAPGTVVGELLQPVAESVGLNRVGLIAVGGHDTASAFAAAPVDNPDEALIISSGTWSLVGRLIAEPITTREAMAANISNEGGIGNIRFLKNCMGTWLAQELRRGWTVADGRETSWDEITRLADEATAFGSLVDPDDASFYNPSNMETAIVDFCKKTNQPPPANRGAFLRMIYESLALKYRMVNEQICSVCGKQSRQVNIVGGGSRNELLNQFTADATGMPVLAGPVEATAVGNFMVQALGLGALDSMADTLPIIKDAFPIKRYAPRDTSSWDKAYPRFRNVCERGMALR